MPANPLTSSEREDIFVLIMGGRNDTEIARELGRSPSTIGREIARCGGREKYRPHKAAKIALRRRSRPKPYKLVVDPELAAQVEERLMRHDSPMRISIELEEAGTPISHECIYQSIHNQGRGLRTGLSRCLRLKRRRRKHRSTRPATDTNSLGKFKPISQRPQIAWARTEIGHLEGDLIVGAMNRSAIVTVFDRKSRHLWLAGMLSKNADDCLEAVVELLGRIPEQARKTLTWDQGAEMARHTEIAQHCGIPIYFAEPKSPWQRPTNENGNGLVRHHVGKGTDLTEFRPDDLRYIESRINTIPRRIFNWSTAKAIYHAELAMTD